ncbi:uncharacterized protein LALA0_S04e06216g [Lachancea lanzarotensis]|uniref:LALA0S04e06216g1_1 n=1 Tax=Lachancea lanzarotensis TaxID=1245769 RepID=A0A0C7N9G6_9SACH|nr:uncharacterized protein LALA0_S04e06216g [Lachancea lanzarotensis]CEP62033.1 LALA0S04e06216g1_1 [Lachancea lanzarotensis]
MSDSKQKRNSFFFFSSKNSGPKSEPKVPNVKYVGKYPLMSSTKARSESAASEGSNSTTRPSNPPDVHQPQDHAVKDPVSVDADPHVERSNRRRPPPPELQFPGMWTNNTALESNINQGSKQNNEDRKRVPQSGHQRKKSDIDELMDHLDQFGHESQGDYESESLIGSSSSNDHFETPSLNLGGDNVEKEGQLHAKFGEETNSDQNFTSPDSKRSDDRLQEPHKSISYGETIEDDDRFSFANSQVESVTELQRLSFNSEPKTTSISSQKSQEVVEHGQYSSNEQRAVGENLTDSEESSSNYCYGDDQSFTDKPRRFRVVNEHRPNFTLNDGSSTNTDSESFILTPVLSSLPKQHTEAEQSHLTSTLPTIKSSSPSTSEGLEHQLSSSGSLPAQENDLSPRSGPESEFTIQDQFAEPQETARLQSPHRSGTDKSVKLVSGYVEELRLKYFPTSNSLQPPPNLPFVLKTKNSLEQPQNIKVKIRTSSKQIGIKHGKAKQKLLSLETAKEEEETDSAMNLHGKDLSVSTEVDHTQEFHDLLNKSTSGANLLYEGSQAFNGENENPYDAESDDLYLRNIPGDEAYDSDDVMAPLRDRGEHSGPLRFANVHEGGRNQVGRANGRVNRSDTVTSYYTRQNINRARSGTLDTNYVNTVHKGLDRTLRDQIGAENSSDDELSVQTSNPAYLQSTFNGGLRVTNQDPGSDEG